jgi:capsular polysaccharide biosynthesis protein
MKASAVAWVLKRYRILITLMTLISCVAGFVYSMYVMKPVYTSKVLMIITTVDELMIQKFDYVTILANRQLVQTYTEIMQSNRVLQRIAAELGNSITTEQLSAALSVSQVGGTEIIEISARDIEPQQAANIANTTANVFIQHIGETFKVNNLKILDTAVPGKAPVQPSHLLHTIVATLLGLAIAVAAALTYVYIRQPVGMPGVLDEEVKLLARVPPSKRLRNNWAKVEEVLNNKAIKNCYLFLQTLLVEKAALGKAILLTSITPQENKLTIAEELVVTLIQSGYRVTLVNTDFTGKSRIIPYMLQGEAFSENIPVTGGRPAAPSRG